MPYEENNTFDCNEMANMPLQIFFFLQLGVLNNVSYQFWLMHFLTILSVCDGSMSICTYIHIIFGNLLAFCHTPKFVLPFSSFHSILDLGIICIHSCFIHVHHSSIKIIIAYSKLLAFKLGFVCVDESSKVWHWLLI